MAIYGSGAGLTNTGGLKATHTFTSSGTWNKPSGINTIKVIVTGGGGGGGGGAYNSNTGGGGGAGGTAIEFLDVSSGYSAVTVTVGNGGSGGSFENHGSDGGNS